MFYITFISILIFILYTGQPQPVCKHLFWFVLFIQEREAKYKALHKYCRFISILQPRQFGTSNFTFLMLNKSVQKHKSIHANSTASVNQTNWTQSDLPTLTGELVVHQQVTMPSNHLRISRCPSRFAPTTYTDASRRVSQRCTPSPCACGSSPAPVQASGRPSPTVCQGRLTR